MDALRPSTDSAGVLSLWKALAVTLALVTGMISMVTHGSAFSKMVNQRPQQPLEAPVENN